MTIFDVIDKAKAAGWSVRSYGKQQEVISDGSWTVYFSIGGMMVEWKGSRVEYALEYEGESVQLRGMDSERLWLLLEDMKRREAKP